MAGSRLIGYCYLIVRTIGTVRRRIYCVLYKGAAGVNSIGPAKGYIATYVIVLYAL